MKRGFGFRVGALFFENLMHRDKCLLIINPISGTPTKERRRVSALTVKKLAKAGMDVEIRYTEGPGDATKWAADAASKGYLGVIAAGGDGTVNEVATGLIGSKTALGIIPLGSGNGLGRHLGLTSDISDAISVIAEKHIHPCDSCSVNGLPFFCTFGLGFDAAVSEKFAESKTRGLVTYLRSALHEYLTYSPDEYEIEANGRKVKLKAFIVAVCNASQYGNNAFIAPAASIKDGLVDITIVHADTPLTQAIFGVDLLTGMVKNNMIIQTLRAKDVRIRKSGEGIAHVDGEPITIGESMEVKCHPGNLLIFLRGDKKPFKPLVTPFIYLSREIGSKLRRILGLGISKKILFL